MNNYDIVFLGGDGELYYFIRNALREYDLNFYRIEKLDDLGRFIVEKAPSLIMLSPEMSDVTNDGKFAQMRMTPAGKIPMFLFTKKAAAYRDDSSFKTKLCENLKKVWQESVIPVKFDHSDFKVRGRAASNQRKHSRIKIKTQVEILPSGSNSVIKGTIRNLSAGGISVSTRNRIPDTASFTLKFSLEEGKMFSAGSVKTRDLKSKDHWHTAFMFENISPSDSDDLDNYAKYLNFLKRLSVFNEFNDEELLYILRTAKRFKAPSGSIIFSEGSPGRNFYVVLEGKIRIFKKIGQEGARKDKFLAFIHPGEFFGEMALLIDITRSGSAQAAADTVLFRIDRDSLDHLLSERSDMAVKLYRTFVTALVKRLNSTDQELIDCPFTLPTNFEKM